MIVCCNYLQGGDDILDIKLLTDMIDLGFVTKKKHPSEKLFIYNYTSKTQYEQLWNDITLMTRGLILDDNYNIVSRPFPKFFSLEESRYNTYGKKFETFYKLDGSLGIGYWIRDDFYISTRGSFISSQAQFASNLIRTKYQGIKQKIEKNKTYLFEIIYPENRIVVDYGHTFDIFLLAIIDIKTGKELPIYDIGIPMVKQYPGVHNIDTLKKLNTKNEEGFVIKFEDDTRIKIKFEEYVKLHKIITQLSTTIIWEHLQEDPELSGILDHITGESYDWVQIVKSKLEDHYTNIVNECTQFFKTSMALNFKSRKEIANHFVKFKYSHILFSMLDNNDYSNQIWKIIKPKYTKLFYNNRWTP